MMIPLLLTISLASAQDPTPEAADAPKPPVAANPCVGLTETSDPAVVASCAADAETAWAAAKKSNSVKAYRAYRAAHPGSAHESEAIDKESAAALKDIEKIDTPEAWRALRQHYPVHDLLAQEREIKAVARDVGASAEMDLPCETPEPTEEVKKPKPTCEFIEAEKLIRATWKTPEGYHARPRLVGWDGKNAVDLTSLLRKIGPAPYASQYAAIARASKGGVDETSWRIELPVDLKLPPGQGLIGYAVELKVMGKTAKLLPFIVTEEWENTRVRTR